MQSSDTQSDAELVAAVHAGHNGAFALLYERHRRSTVGFCRRIVRDNALAEDIVQDTFIKAQAAYFLEYCRVCSLMVASHCTKRSVDEAARQESARLCT